MRGKRDARRSTRRALVALMSLVGVLLVVLPAAANASEPNYVAIGDSYTAGPGIPPTEEGSPAKCARSMNNYPHLVAAALKLKLTDVSCSGAATKDETGEQFPGETPPQDNALSAATEVVTIGMGGNDNGLFSDLLNGCTNADAIEQRPGKAPCKEEFQSFVTETFAADKGPQEEALAHIKELAPNAKVFVVGYPDITPKKGTCFSSFPWKEGDLKWFRSGVQKVGNSSIKAGAKAHGALFVDTFKKSEGHDACQPLGVRWVEPIIGSATGVPVHPNATGEEQDAYDVELAMLKAHVR